MKPTLWPRPVPFLAGEGAFFSADFRINSDFCLRVLGHVAPASLNPGVCGGPSALILLQRDHFPADGLAPSGGRGAAAVLLNVVYLTRELTLGVRDAESDWEEVAFHSRSSLAS